MEALQKNDLIKQLYSSFLHITTKILCLF